MRKNGSIMQGAAGMEECMDTQGPKKTNLRWLQRECFVDNWI
jgi:hypothetical protein